MTLSSECLQIIQTQTNSFCETTNSGFDSKQNITQFLNEHMSALIFYTNQTPPQEVGELSSELAQRFTDIQVKAEPIEKLPEALTQLNPQKPNAVILMTNGLNGLPPNCQQALSRLQSTPSTMIMYPQAIPTGNPSAMLAPTKPHLLDLLSRQPSRLASNLPPVLQTVSSAMPILIQQSQQPAPFTVYTLGSYDQEFNNIMGQMAERYRDKGVQFRNIGSVEEIQIPPNEKAMLISSGRDVVRVLPQLAQYPIRNSLFTVLLSPTVKDAGWDREFSKVASNPNQVETELDKFLQRSMISRKAATSNIGAQQSQLQQPPQVQQYQQVQAQQFQQFQSQQPPQLQQLQPQLQQPQSQLQQFQSQQFQQPQGQPQPPPQIQQQQQSQQFQQSGGIAPDTVQTIRFSQVPGTGTYVPQVICALTPPPQIRSNLSPPVTHMTQTKTTSLSNKSPIVGPPPTSSNHVATHKSLSASQYFVQVIPPSTQQLIRTSRVNAQLPAIPINSSQVAQPAHAYTSYYTGNLGMPQQQTITTSNVQVVDTSVMRPKSVEPIVTSQVVTRAFSADQKIRMVSAKRFNKKKLNPSVYRQPTIYALESQDPTFFAHIESLGIIPAFHPIRGVYQGHKFPPSSILLAPYERRQQVINGIADNVNKDLSCVFYGQHLQEDPILMNHPLVDLATNRFDQVRDYLTVRGIKMTPMPVSATSISVTNLTGTVTPGVVTVKENVIVGQEFKKPLSIIHETNSFNEVNSNILQSQKITALATSQIQGVNTGSSKVHTTQTSNLISPIPMISALRTSNVQMAKPVSPIKQTIQMQRVGSPMPYAVMAPPSTVNRTISPQSVAGPQLMQTSRVVTASALPKSQNNLPVAMSAVQTPPEQIQKEWITKMTPTSPGQFVTQPFGGQQLQSNKIIPPSSRRVIENSQQQPPRQINFMIPGEVKGQMPGQMPGQMQGTQGQMSGQMQGMQGMQGQMPGQMQGTQGQMSGQMPGQMSGQMQGMQGQMSGQMQGIQGMQGQMSGQMQGMQGMQGQMPGQMSGQMQGMQDQAPRSPSPKNQIITFPGQPQRPPLAPSIKKIQTQSQIPTIGSTAFSTKVVNPPKTLPQLVIKLAQGPQQTPSGAPNPNQNPNMRKTNSVEEIGDIDPSVMQIQSKPSIIDERLDPDVRYSRQLLPKPEENQQNHHDSFGMANDGGPTLPGRTTRTDGIQEIGIGSTISGPSEKSSEPSDKESMNKFKKNPKNKPIQENGSENPLNQTQHYLLNNGLFTIKQAKSFEQKNPIQNGMQQFRAPPVGLCLPTEFFSVRYSMPSPHTHKFSIPQKLLEQYQSNTISNDPNSSSGVNPSNHQQNNGSGAGGYETEQPPLLPPQAAPQVLAQRIIRDSEGTVTKLGDKIVKFPNPNSEFQTVVFGPIPMVFQASVQEAPGIKPQSLHWCPDTLPGENQTKPTSANSKKACQPKKSTPNPEHQTTILPQKKQQTQNGTHPNSEDSSKQQTKQPSSNSQNSALPNILSHLKTQSNKSQTSKSQKKSTQNKSVPAQPLEPPPEIMQNNSEIENNHFPELKVTEASKIHPPGNSTIEKKPTHMQQSTHNPNNPPQLQYYERQQQNIQTPQNQKFSNNFNSVQTPTFSRHNIEYEPAFYNTITYEDPNRSSHVHNHVYTTNIRNSSARPSHGDSTIKYRTETTNPESRYYITQDPNPHKMKIQSNNLRQSQRNQSNHNSRVSGLLDPSKFDVRIQNGIQIYSRKPQQRSSSSDYYYRKPQVEVVRHMVSNQPTIRVPQYTSYSTTPAHEYGYNVVEPANVIRSSRYRKYTNTEPSVQDARGTRDHFVRNYTYSENHQRAKSENSREFLRKSRQLVRRVPQQTAGDAKILYSYDEKQLEESLVKEFGNRIAMEKYYDIDSLMQTAAQNINRFVIIILDSALSEYIKDLKQYTTLAKFLIFDRQGSEENDPNILQTPTIGEVIKTIKSLI